MIALETPEHNRIGSVGRSLPSVDIVIDPRNNEIIVQGDCVMLGYLGDCPSTLELNFSKKYNSIFRTGDKGEWLENGFLKIQGRVKNEYKLSNGKYVDPSNLESILGLHPHIYQCVITHDSMYKSNVAIVYSNFKLDKDIFLKEIQSFCKDKMEYYEIPKRLILVSDPFTIENGLLSLKHEVKREMILLKYKDLVNA
jgi:long-chain acyl-CoA synthetase